MEAYAEAAFKAAAVAENALRIALDQRDTDFTTLDSSLERLRKTTQDYIFLTFPSPAAKLAEDKLWDGHLKTNKKFQKHLKQFREGAGKKKQVERRKAERLYLHFIKSSMQFYRGYIQRLASHFASVPEIKAVAAKLHLDILSIEPSATITVDQKELLLVSCHSALMRLGDLSRYRETELESRNRNWGPAKGHYQLALSIMPESGAAYNQLAVMALADDDHLRAVYYLHRAATTSKAFPVAQNNIKLEFEKLLKFEPEEKSAVADTSRQTIEVLENRFLAFHANCHSHPSEFVTYTAKATQMLQLLTLGFEEVKDRSLDKFVQKMCIINIAAEHLAWKGTSVDRLSVVKQNGATSKHRESHKGEDALYAEHHRNCQAFYLLQRFNILTFTTLLKVAARELGSESEPGSQNRDETVPPSVRRLLPHLRQYSSWLLTNVHTFLEPRHVSTGKCLDLFWKTYVTTINLLLSKYPISEIADLDHLLEEDEETLSFMPFSDNVVVWRFNVDGGPCKPSYSLPAERPVEQEALARIRRLVFDAATITTQQEKLRIDWTPIALLEGEFTIQNKPVAVTVAPPAKPSTPSQPFRSRAHAHASSLNGISPSQSPKREKEVKRKQKSILPLPQRNILKDNSTLSSAPTEQTINTSASGQGVGGALLPNQSTSLASIPAPVASFDTSSLLTGTQSGMPMNIMDIVRDMQRRAAETAPQQDSKPDIMDFVRSMQQKENDDGLISTTMPARENQQSSNPSLPGIWNTAFTPRLGEATGTSPRPETASGLSTMFGAPMSSATFQSNMLQQERDIQSRTSPFQPQPFSSWPEPQMSPKLQNPVTWTHDPKSPWNSPSAQSPTLQTRQNSQPTFYGAIGEHRRHESRP